MTTVEFRGGPLDGRLQAFDRPLMRLRFPRWLEPPLVYRRGNAVGDFAYYVYESG
jgi:hypothetical protein